MTTTNLSIDLHAHTTASDGSLTPTQLVELANQIGLSAIAVTDHDTIAGIYEALAVSASIDSLELVPGVELSVEDEQFKFHMLGYLFDLKNPILADTLEELRRRRSIRNAKIIEQAHALGLDLSWEDVLAEVKDGGEVVGRPHIAAAMVKKGVVPTAQAAFDNLLTPGKPLYFSKNGLSAKEGIDLLHEAGGVAVMAHPGLTKWADPAKLRPILTELRDLGLDGLEVYYSQHSVVQTDVYHKLAVDLGLFETGGSDFHGDPKPHVFLGQVTNRLPADSTLLESLKAHAKSKSSVSLASP